MELFVYNISNFPEWLAKEAAGDHAPLKHPYAMSVSNRNRRTWNATA
jgi:hypothetical protein